MSFNIKCCVSGQRVSVVINFLCDETIDLGQPEFSKIEEQTYIFTFSTALACSPKPTECKVFDAAGNLYDLTTLAKEDFWKALDTRDDKTAYFINVCRPVNNVPDGQCPGKL